MAIGSLLEGEAQNGLSGKDEDGNPTGEDRIPLDYLESLFGSEVGPALDKIKAERAKKQAGEESDLMDTLISKNFLDLFSPADDPDDVIIEFQNSRVADHSAIEAIDNLAEKYIKAGKKLHLRHLSPECKVLLTKAGDLV